MLFSVWGPQNKIDTYAPTKKFKLYDWIGRNKIKYKLFYFSFPLSFRKYKERIKKDLHHCCGDTTYLALKKQD